MDTVSRMCTAVPKARMNRSSSRSFNLSPLLTHDSNSFFFVVRHTSTQLFSREDTAGSSARAEQFFAKEVREVS